MNALWIIILLKVVWKDLKEINEMIFLIKCLPNDFDDGENKRVPSHIESFSVLFSSDVVSPKTATTMILWALSVLLYINLAAVIKGNRMNRF